MKKSFTLIELLIVIAVIGLMAALIIPRLGNLTEDAETATSQYNARAIASQITMFQASTGKYPAKFHTGCSTLGRGYGCLGSTDYHNNINPTTGTGVGGAKATNPSIVCAGLSENVRSNLANAIQVPVNGPVAKSLADAGISRVIFGEPNVRPVPDTVGLGSNAQWDPNQINESCEIALADNFPAGFSQQNGAIGFLCANSWKDANGNEIMIGGRTIPQYINQPLGDLTYVRQVAVFIVGPQVDWLATYNTNGTVLGTSKVGIMQNHANSNPKTYCVAFFAVDMGDPMKGIAPKPAVFLGCVDADGKPITK